MRKFKSTGMLKLSHKNLDVYRFSIQLLEEIYKTTKSFPKEEQYTLVNQLRRAAISVCSNIAEGASRLSKKREKDFMKLPAVPLLKLIHN